MKKILIIFFIIISSITAYTQNEEIKLLEEQLKNAKSTEEISILNDLSHLYLEIDTKKTIYYAEKGIKKSKKQQVNSKITGSLYNSLGAAYFYNGKYRKSLKFYEKELNIIISNSSDTVTAKAFYNIAVLYKMSGKERKAATNFEKSLETAKSNKINDIVLLNYRALYELYFNWGKYEKALENLQQYYLIIDNNFQINRNKMSIMKKEITNIKKLKKKTEKELNKTKKNVNILKKDTLKKSREIEELNYENELISQINKQEKEIYNAKQELNSLDKEKRKLQRNIFIGLSIIAIIILVIIYIGYQQKKRSNKLLIKKNIEINQQKEEIYTQAENLKIANIKITKQKNKIEESHKQITDSINYASRIQTAILPVKEKFELHFSDFFIFNKPVNIVSGDFYWTTKVNKYQILAVADCTGHGIPGAFVSMLGVSLLNEIVRRKYINTASRILNELRMQIKMLLKQTSQKGSTKDGMDIALCMLNTETNILQFAGAYNPLYVLLNKNNRPERIVDFIKNPKIKIHSLTEKQSNILVEVKADRQPIGIYRREKKFTNNLLKIEKNDILYLFSDGYIDQFGGIRNQKYKSNNFRNLILKISDEKMTKQNQIIKEEYEKWKGDNNQIDDVLIVGVKIK